MGMQTLSVSFKLQNYTKITSTDQVFTHGRIDRSHTVDQTVSTKGYVMGRLFAHGLFNRVQKETFADDLRT
jgi:hypothetical protein